MSKRGLQTVVTSSPFDTSVSIALAAISPVDATRKEYRRDFELWLTFCREINVDHASPPDGSVAAWIEWMKRKNHAPKSRARRMSSLSSIYRELRRKRVVPANPFSVDDGPKREKVSVVEPTQLATVEDVRTALASCAGDTTPLGIRDEAIIRVLWATGMRRVSLLSMTFEKISKDRLGGYLAHVLKKGGDDQRVLIRGKAKVALDRWLQVMRDGSLTTGPIWRTKAGVPITARGLNRALAKRSSISPHMLRVAFLTYNPASIESKQDAAGHADINTTRLYDRTSWKGRDAFEQMPEIEDTES